MAQNISVTGLTAPKEKARALSELNKVVDSAQEILATAKTAFPFDLFPDTLTVDRTQVTIAHHSFFFVGGVTSIRVEDILNVTAEVGPILGSLRISTRFFDPDKPYYINKFWREDALKVQAIIQGLVIAANKEIDTAVFEKEELVDHLTKVGQASPNDTP